MLKRYRLRAVRHFILLVVVLLCSSAPLSAGSPAFYSPDTDKILWFIHASDVHIGAYQSPGSANLEWLVTQAKSVIDPSFIVVTGDLTDSTNGNPLGLPNGPYQEEWDLYKSILSSNGVNGGFYFDMPGNHDAYNDPGFAYYLANSVQGRETGSTQVSWTRNGPWGEYHFLGVNTADNTGSPFSFNPPYGDHAGLDASELSFIEGELAAHRDASLALIFGHHPLAPTANSSDTYLYYGKDEIVSLMNNYGVSLYGYGHIHESTEGYYSENMTKGVFYVSVAALGKGSPNEYRVFAIDCNGISFVSQAVGTWPVVLITAPVNRYLGAGVNPYAYTVPTGTSNPIRALVFDPGTVSQVQFRVDGGSWQSMTAVPANSHLWQGAWDASTLAEGEYQVEVEATTGSGIRTDAVVAYVTSKISSSFDTVQKVYIGYYQRPADPAGLIYWADRLEKTNGSLDEIIEAYANSPESRDLYGTIDGGSIGAVIDAIYLALFGRPAEDAGKAFYMEGFNAGRFTAATIMLNVLNGAQNADLLSVTNKLAAANLFTRTIDPEFDGRNFQVTYAGNADAIWGRAFLASVTDDAATVPTPDQTAAYMKSHIADPGDPIFTQ